MKKTRRKAFWIILVLIALLVIIMFASGAIQVDVLKAWTWVTGGISGIVGKIVGFFELKSLIILIVGAFVGFVLGFKVRGWAKEEE